MALVINLSKLHLNSAIVFLIFNASFIISDAKNDEYVISDCYDEEYALKASFVSNLNRLLSSLPEKAGKSKNNGYYTTNSKNSASSDSETIYILLLCQGDATPDSCKGCVSAAADSIQSVCPKSKEAVIWYDKCMVHYSNKSFVGDLDENKNIGSRSIGYIPDNDVNEFMKLAWDTLYELASNISKSKGLGVGDRKYYSTKGGVDFNSVMKLYNRVQCKPDLAPMDCQRCLKLMLSDNRMATFCNGTRGCQVLNPSCNLRYELYPFYDEDMASPPPVTSLSPLPLPIKGDYHKRTRNILGRMHVITLTISSVLIILLLYGVWSCVCKKKVIKTTVMTEVSEITEVVLDSFQFNLNAILIATNNFAASNKLGEGGFGEVYKGKLEDGQEIAVKRLSKNSGQGAVEFKNEVVLVAKLRHKNLVKLLGFCVTLEEKILVYEFLPNSSLDRFLFDKTKKVSLDWQTMFKIIIGIAKGLLYLHEDSPLKIIHRDLKSSNILLDEDMNPKISDFGLAKLFGVDQTQGDTKRIVGTYGYMAPEYAITGHYSVKSDVFSFGVLVLEIVSGQRNRFFGRLQLEEALLHRAWRLWNEEKILDLVDTTLDNFPMDEVTKCIRIGLLCIQEDAVLRPKMTSIVAALNGQAITLPEPKPPHFFGTNIVEDSEIQNNSHGVYTGTVSFTDLYPRE